MADTNGEPRVGTDPDGPPIGRQAVVVVHGQGEQRPMGTIRDFVETLWTRDHTLELKDSRLRDEDGNRSWIVPDDKGGLYDIQRITCPELVDGRRTDFFELYYADILSATPFRTLWNWLRRLLWIDPRDVTVRMRWPWSVFWVLALVAAILFWAVLLSSRRILDVGWAEILADPASQPGLLIALGAVVLLVLPRLTPLALFLTVIPPWVAGLLVFVGTAMIFWSYPTFWYVSGLVFEVYLALRFLLPYFGDAASYLSAHTETVESRQLVRLRGLQLLDRLHMDPDYDRVIIVGHSLGSVLAYDLLHILWAQDGPLKHNPPTAEASAALREVDEFVSAHPEAEWSAETISDYQALQWRALDMLRRQKAVAGAAVRNAGWKISDLVTLGSPLTSAQFIVADGAEDFERLKRDRVMPTAPARSYNVEHETLYPDARGHEVAHHGAVFSTVRWTNIYDPFHPFAFLYGDAVAGPVGGAELFGAGVRDDACSICRGERLERAADGSVRHRCRWPMFSRAFTHNHYWTNTSGDWRHPSAHVVALRRAVGIDRPVP